MPKAKNLIQNLNSEERHELIEKQVEEFLANGGKITRIEAGASGKFAWHKDQDTPPCTKVRLDPRARQGLAI